MTRARNPYGQFLSRAAQALTAQDDELGFAAMALGLDRRRDGRKAMRNLEQIKDDQAARRRARIMKASP